MKHTAYWAAVCTATACGMWLVLSIAAAWPQRIITAAVVALALSVIAVVFMRNSIEDDRAAVVEDAPPIFVDPRQSPRSDADAG